MTKAIIVGKYDKEIRVSMNTPKFLGSFPFYYKIGCKFIFQKGKRIKCLCSSDDYPNRTCISFLTDIEWEMRKITIKKGLKIYSRLEF